MLGVIARVLLVLGFLILHVTVGAIHMVLVGAMVVYVLHLLRGRGVV